MPTANVLKAKLEAEGIPALLKYDSGSTVWGLTVNGLGEVKIQVPENFAEEARNVLGIKADNSEDK